MRVRVESRRHRLRFLPGLLAAVSLMTPGVACSAEVQRLRVEVIREIPHDVEAFTQGLLFHDGGLYESTGQYASSSLRRLEVDTGAVEKRLDLPEDYFGEGLERVGDRLVQLTWHAGLAFVYDLDSFQLLHSLRYQGEGWGLCLQDEELLMSNGSSWIVRRDPDTMRDLDRFQVVLGGTPIDQINELECAEGWIYANVWHAEHILRIDPSTGEVVAVIDASELRSRLGGGAEGALALNGIAFRPDTATFFLTGKYWPKMFEVIFVE